MINRTETPADYLIIPKSYYGWRGWVNNRNSITQKLLFPVERQVEK